MADPLVNLVVRRFRAIVLTLGLTAALALMLVSRSLSMRDTAHLSGWILLSLTLFLTLYNARKKLTHPPLFRASTWLQFHIYGGVLSVVAFLFHIRFQFPNGRVEIVLAALFVGVAGSGVVGLFLSRVIPPRLAVRGEEVIFERIPIFRLKLRQQAEQLIVDCVESAPASTLANFYTERLAGFFDGPQHYLSHLAQSSRRSRRLLEELRALDRYFGDRERAAARELTDLIEAKDSLDYHHAMQGTLKGWLFVHIPLTFAMLVFVFVHVVLVHAFRGGAS